MNLKKRIKNGLAAMGLSFCLFGASAPAHAGIPVIDVANLAQAIMEVLAWVQQAQDMIAQIQEAKNTVSGIQTTISKLDGGRNLGSILNDPTIKSALPSEMQNAVSVLMSPNGVTANAATMSNVLAAFGITVPPTGITKATELADMFLKNQAMLQSAQTRGSQLTQLKGAVDTSADAKASSDLVARATLENSEILNNLTQLLAAQELAKQQAAMRDISAEQAEQARLQAYFASHPLP